MEIEEEGKQWMSKASNQLLVSALDNCDIINAFTVLLRLMTQATQPGNQMGKGHHEKFTEMVTRCLLRITKRLISTAALLEWSRTVQLLRETNSFLVQHPTGEDIYPLSRFPPLPPPSLPFSLPSLLPLPFSLFIFSLFISPSAPLFLPPPHRLPHIYV
jgi:hypothetical protein